MTEIRKSRKANRKIFRQSKDLHRACFSTVPMHYTQEDGALRTIDLLPRAGRDGLLEVRRAPYIVRALPDGVGYLYTSKKAGFEVRVELVALDGVPVNINTAPVASRGKITWEQISPGLDVYLECRSTGVELFKVRHTASSAREYTWRVTRPTGLAMNMDTRAQDAEGRSVRCECTSVVQGTHRGKEELLLTELVTDQVAKPDKHRRRSWTDGPPAYPVLVDVPDVTEEIEANADDGEDGGPYPGVWRPNGYSNLVRFGRIPYPTPFTTGLRFQDVAISGWPITLATLKVYLAVKAGTPIVKVYGVDDDNAAAFSNGNLPSGMTKTTAFTDWTPGTPEEVVELDVTDIVNEVVQLPGWATGNSLAFGIFDQTGVATNSGSIADSSHPTLPAPQLEVTYYVPPASGSTASSRLYGRTKNLYWHLYRK